MPLGMEIKDLVGIAAGILVTIVFGYFFLYKGFRRKQIVYTSTRYSIVWTRVEGLEVAYRGTPVEALIRLTIRLWNAGNEPITAADLPTKDPLRLAIHESWKVLKSEVTDQTRPANSASIADGVITFDYLNSGDGVVVELLLDSGSEAPYWQRHGVWVEGEVIGAHKPPKYVDYSKASWSYPGKLLLIGVALLLMSQTVQIVWGTVHLSDWYRDWRLVFKVVASVGLMAGGVGLIAHTLWRMATTERVPKALFPTLKEESESAVVQIQHGHAFTAKLDDVVSIPRNLVRSEDTTTVLIPPPTKGGRAKPGKKTR
jgi:hypothetical protein